MTLMALLLMSAGAAAAQDWRGTGRLVGTVVDESGAPVEGVVVKAQRDHYQGEVDTLQTQLLADEDGRAR